MTANQQKADGETGLGDVGPGGQVPAEAPPAPLAATGDAPPPPPKPVPQHKAYVTCVADIMGILAVCGKSQEELGKRINAGRTKPGSLMRVDIVSPHTGEKTPVWLDAMAVRFISTEYVHKPQPQIPPGLQKIIENAGSNIEDDLAKDPDPDTNIA